jgi:hypothetical protein
MLIWQKFITEAEMPMVPGGFYKRLLRGIWLQKDF